MAFLEHRIYIVTASIIIYQCSVYQSHSKNVVSTLEFNIIAHRTHIHHTAKYFKVSSSIYKIYILRYQTTNAIVDSLYNFLQLQHIPNHLEQVQSHIGTLHTVLDRLAEQSLGGHHTLRQQDAEPVQWLRIAGCLVDRVARQLERSGSRCGVTAAAAAAVRRAHRGQCPEFGRVLGGQLGNGHRIGAERVARLGDQQLTADDRVLDVQLAPDLLLDEVQHVQVQCVDERVDLGGGGGVGHSKGARLV